MCVQEQHELSISMYHAGVQLGAFPAVAKLSSLPRLSEAKKSASTGAEAEAGDEVKLVKADAAVFSTQTVVVAPALSKKVALKILNGEYVDFAELPPAKGRAKPTSLDWEGQVLLVQSTGLYAAKKLIPDLATRVQCFSIYTTVLCSQSPERLPDLLGYAAFLAKCSQKFKWPSWVVYDQNFCQLAAEVHYGMGKVRPRRVHSKHHQLCPERGRVVQALPLSGSHLHAARTKTAKS